VSSDEQAIIELAIAYTWALDTKHLDALRSVFATDATADLNGVHCEGQDAIIARIERPLSRLDATQHLVGNHQVQVDGDTATHRCHLQSQHVKRGTAGGDNYLIGGIYEDRLARRPEGWRITHRTMTAVWTDGNAAVIGR
jgi:ketosteroid isomerase-like protein